MFFSGVRKERQIGLNRKNIERKAACHTRTAATEHVAALSRFSSRGTPHLRATSPYGTARTQIEWISRLATDRHE